MSSTLPNLPFDKLPYGDQIRILKEENAKLKHSLESSEADRNKFFNELFETKRQKIDELKKENAELKKQSHPHGPVGNNIDEMKFRCPHNKLFERIVNNIFISMNERPKDLYVSGDPHFKKMTDLQKFS
jgi:hypothetical protein